MTELKSGRFFVFSPTLKTSSTGWNQLEFQLRFRKIDYDTVKDDRGRISMVLYEDDESIEELCRKAERFRS